MSELPTPLPTWLLERYALGELSAAQAAGVRERLATSPEERSRLEAIEASNREVLFAYPPAKVAAQVHKRLGHKPRPRLALYLAVPTLAAAALLTLVVDPGPVPRTEELPTEVTRTKGLRPRLLVYRVRGQNIDRLEDGAVARAGDALQLRYVSAQRAYGAVYSVDGRGQVTLHFPEAAGADTSLRPQGEVSLPHGYELDDAPKFERFVFVTSEKPVDVEALLSAVRSSRPSPEGLEAFTFTVRKESP